MCVIFSDVFFLQLLAVIYDPQYALRLCSEHKLTRACVLIYAAMGLYEESVDHALLVSVTCLYVCFSIRAPDVMNPRCACAARVKLKADNTCSNCRGPLPPGVIFCTLVY